MQQAIPNPALQSLAGLVGTWSTEMSHMSFLPDPAAIVRGQERCVWLEGGAFLMLSSQAEPGDFPNAIMVIGRDEAVATYNVLYFDSRGVSRVYEMSLERGVWKMWRNAPGFCQRFTGTFSTDGNTITARWEKSRDGSEWEHDFDLTFRRNDQ